jgi:hypothetical protein
MRMRKLVVAGPTLDLAAVLTVLLIAVGSSRADTRPLNLRGWAAPASLQMRIARDGHILLHPGTAYVEAPAGAHGDEAYELDPVSLKIASATAAMWEAAPGTIHQCDREGVPNPRRLRIEQNRVVKIDDRAVQTYGLPRGLALNHEGNILAVLSARGSVRPGSPLPFIGEKERVVGPRYHEFFSFPSGHPLAKPLALQRDDDPTPCWDPDDKLIIYSDDLFSKVNIVPAHFSGGE